MRSNEILSDYYNHLVNIATDGDISLIDAYSELFQHLFGREFYWNPRIKLDETRAMDGKYIRKSYISSNGYSIDIFDGILPEYCTVFEMMLALAHRWEMEFMYDPDEGDRTWMRFFEMLENLGLDRYRNSRYNQEEVNRIIDILLNRQYDSSGRNGGMFPMRWHSQDMRKTDLWYQLNFYLVEHPEYLG